MSQVKNIPFSPPADGGVLSCQKDHEIPCFYPTIPSSVCLYTFTHHSSFSSRSSSQEYLSLFSVSMQHILDEPFAKLSLWVENAFKSTYGYLGYEDILPALVVFLIGFFWLRPRYKRPKGCLDPERYKDFKLVKRTQLTHNTAKFRFALRTPDSVLGLPIGQHVRCRGNDSQGNEITKPYTPVTLDSDRGYFELVVKMYPKGRMSHHFREMREGDYLPVRGPEGKFKYKLGQVKSFGMIAGGTGITPMFQVTRAILENPKDNTKIHLLYANTTAHDILLKEELDGLVGKYPDQFKVYYVLTQQPPQEWKGGAGHINKEMIQEHCPPPASDIMILMCGPPAMNNAMKAHLDKLGYTPEMQFKF